jgi:hypothetical protein
MLQFGKYCLAAALIGGTCFAFAQEPTHSTASAIVTAVPTKDVNNIALGTPVNFISFFSISPDSAGGTSAAFTVPTGKRLITQYVSVQCDLPAGGDAIGNLESNQDNPGTPSLLSTFVPMRSVPLPSKGLVAVRSVGGTPLQQVFDEDRSVNLVVNRTIVNGTASCFGGFAGYLVPKP